MSDIAIKGHATRGKEVIQILEMLGGKNAYNLPGDTSCAYYVIEGNEIHRGLRIHGTEPYTILTLEEFLKKYPYKIKDRVRVPEYKSEVYISKMYWDGNEVQYEVVTDEVEWYSAEELNKFNEPYKKEPKELLIGFTKDSNGNWVLNAHKDYEIKEVDGKFKLVLKKPTYPKTYEECARLLNTYCGSIGGYNWKLLSYFQQLLICRDAYWKIAGEEMGLGETWKPNWTGDTSKYTICSVGYRFELCTSDVYNRILAFPTKEMRDIFFENFKELIEICKEFL